VVKAAFDEVRAGYTVHLQRIEAGRDFGVARDPTCVSDANLLSKSIPGSQSFGFELRFNLG
jgi:hypothetical protein